MSERKADEFLEIVRDRIDAGRKIKHPPSSFSFMSNIARIVIEGYRNHLERSRDVERLIPPKDNIDPLP